jgi:sulfate adenylyltransferase
VLDVSEKEADSLNVGQKVLLLGEKGKPMALLHLSEKYSFDKSVFAEKLFGTTDKTHPGVQQVHALKPVFLAGKIDLIERRQAETAPLELTPRQTRRLFAERGWSRVVGFHTRNVIHRSHEFIQMQALERSFADGLFVHPVVGKKKAGDFNQKYIVAAYDLMMRKFYPKNKVLFAALATYSRYAGPKEALFTAIVRQNFGCSHFIVGRDHTGVGDFYSPTASHDIFDRFPDLGIQPIRFNQVFFSKKLKKQVHEKDDARNHSKKEMSTISGTQAREMLVKGKLPPSWFMRREIAQPIADAIKRGEDVFVK